MGPAGRPDLPLSPAFLLLGLGRVVRDEVEGRLRRSGSSLRQLSALGHLSHEPGLSYSELARRAGVTAQSMQATLRQLQDVGAVERRSQPGRGNTARLHVTARGADLLRRGAEAVAETDQNLFGDLPPDQRAGLSAVLVRVFGAATGRRPPADAAGDGRSTSPPG